MEVNEEAVRRRMGADVATGRKARASREDVASTQSGELTTLDVYTSAVRASARTILAVDMAAGPLVRSNAARAVGGFARDLLRYAAEHASGDGDSDDSDGADTDVICYPVVLRPLVAEVAAIAALLPLSAADHAALTALVSATPEHGVTFAGGYVACNACGVVHRARRRVVACVWTYKRGAWHTTARNDVRPVLHPSEVIPFPQEGERYAGQRYDVQGRCTSCSNRVAPSGAGLR